MFLYSHFYPKPKLPKAKLFHRPMLCFTQSIFLSFLLQTGPGLVFMKWRSSVGDGIFLHSITPKEPLLQIMRHSLYASWTVPTILAKFFLYGEALQVFSSYCTIIVYVLMLDIHASLVCPAVIFVFLLLDWN